MNAIAATSKALCRDMSVDSYYVRMLPLVLVLGHFNLLFYFIIDVRSYFEQQRSFEGALNAAESVVNVIAKQCCSQRKPRAESTQKIFMFQSCSQELTKYFINKV